MTESSRAAFLGPANAGGPSTEGDYEEVEVPYEDGRLTPTQADPYPPILKIKGAEGKSEPLDKRFRVERSSKFAPGLVIKILWSEPRSENSKTLNTYTEVGQEHMFGKLVYVGLRRFIVVATDKGHSTCVPIYTYIGKGCKKRGVKPDKHGIIYDIKSKPQMLHGEPELGFVPVGMRIEASGERLARESRVDYSKLVNVEHNVRVFIIGRIDGKHVETVKNAVDTCWNLKISAMG
ncbi:hypothetical protein QBC33DRAFT_263538 [Phialemonium atrogriseum]|uniref:DUF6590 domain-containing protein n=1 Tax=Phialemonium atrogriseum TaxID=1093897 RepID=A0AAJ0C5J4_9PEZI|nr:uncharacterized protein QBC33DRAFT_263538 [Phialemonium atrogriseum]KAK1770365.1 hypothetical protein QBC33DRAFT_263538 [Phialemonium atrogriseum]